MKTPRRCGSTSLVFSTIFPALIAGLFLLVSGLDGLGQDVNAYLIGKSQSYNQNGTGAPTLLPGSEQAFGFVTVAIPTYSGSVFLALLRGPNGQVQTLSETSDGQALIYGTYFDTKSALDTAFPNGIYTFSFYTADDGVRTPSLGVPGDAYPSTPHLTNWSAAQMINSEADFTLAWDAFAGGTLNDGIQVMVLDQFNSEVFVTPDYAAPGAMTGQSRSVVIPANTLMAGESYQARLVFTKVLPLNTLAYPGAAGGVIYFKDTTFPLLTTTPYGTFQFSAANYTANETGSLATITVIRTNGSLGSVTVQYSTADDSAIDGVNYTSTSGTLTFDEGVTMQTFQVVLLNDSFIEGPTSLQLHLDNPLGGANIATVNSAGLTIVDDDVPAGPNVRSYLLAKGQRFEQLGSGAPLLSSNDLPYRFLSSVEPAFSNGVVSVWLKLPNGTTNQMTEQDGQFQLAENFSTKTMLDSAFGAGTYLFSIQTLTDGLRAPSLALPLDSYPPIPHLTNWTPAQEIDAGVDFALAWDAFTGGSSNDFIYVSIEDASKNLIFDSPGFLQAGSLNGFARSFSIPTDTLLPSQNYQGRLLFVKRTSLNTNGYPGVSGLSGYFKETSFPLATISAPPPAGRFRFSASAYSVSETGGVAVITVLRSGGSLGAVSIDFATASGTATPNVDFVPAAGTLTFLEGETNKDFSVSILDDSLLEGNETVALVLSNPVGGADLGKPNNATLTIVDNELLASGTIQFSATNYTVSEAGPAASIIISRTGGAASGVTVDFSTADGSATAGLDYSNVVRTIAFGANETSKTISISIINDTIHEANETVLLSLSNPTGGASLGPKANAVLVIQDNDVGGTISFSSATYSISETGSMARVIVNRAGGAASAVSVDLATTDGSATAGLDYDGWTNTLVFAANESSKTNYIHIIDDTLPEGNETVFLTLRNPTGGAKLGAITNAVLTIVDDEITVQFSSDVYTNNEATAANITILRSGPLTGTVGVTLSTSNGSATSGSDYTGLSTNLTLAAGVPSRTFSIPIINDTIVEGNEMFMVNLSNPVGALLGNRTNATVLIVDNDLGGVIQFSATNYTVSEAGPSASIIVSRTGGSASGVTVDFNTADGTATAGLDYSNVVRTIAFGANEASKTITVPIINDTIQEGNETVLLSLSNPTGGASLGPKANAVLVIQDNDVGGTISFSAATYSISETGSMARVIVNRSGGAASAVSVDLATSDGSATAGLDYDGSTNTLLFAANELSKTNYIHIIDDTLPEGNETVFLTLRNPTGGARLGAISNAVLTIVDDEITLQFSSDVYTNNEATAATITILRSGPLTGTVGVMLSTSDGTATSGSDYTGLSTNLTLAAGVASRTFSIPINNDTIVEGNETFLVNLSNPVGALLGNRTNATVLIVDNDVGGVIQFSATNYTVSEAGPSASIIVSRTGGSASGVTVDFSTADGTATGGLDYSNVVRTITFGANETSKTITVPIINDSIDEPNETVLLSLSNPTGGASLGPKANAVLVIQDNDVAGTISFSAATYSIGEAGGAVNITLNRAGGMAGGVTVDYTMSDGTATAGLDYLATPGTVTFGSNVLSKTFQVQIIDDAIAEGNETVMLAISNPTGGATLGTIQTAVLTIIDDEVYVGGVYSISGAMSSSQCTNSANGTTSGSGQLNIFNQTGHDFTGSGLLIGTSGNEYIQISIIGQVLDGAGKVAGAYTTDLGGTGSISGSISGGKLQLSISGTEDMDSCVDTGSLSGNLYISPAGGFAPATIAGQTITARITTSSGALGDSGSFTFQGALEDNSYEVSFLTEPFSYSTGYYIYTITAESSATLKIINDDTYEIANLTFTSATTGRYTANSIGAAGFQAGTFTLAP